MANPSCRFDLPPAVPLTQFNTLCKVTYWRNREALRGRFEKDEINDEFIKALLKLSSPEQNQVMRRLTDAAIAALEIYLIFGNLSLQEANRLRALIQKYKNPNLRIMPLVRELASKIEFTNVEKKDQDLHRNWGNSFIHLENNPALRLGLLRQVLERESVPRLIKILQSSRNKTLCLEVIDALEKKGRGTMRTEKKAILFVLSEALKSQIPEIQTRAAQALIYITEEKDDELIDQLVKLVEGKDITANIKEKATRMLIGLGEQRIKEFSYSWAVLREEDKKNFRRIKQALKRIALNCKDFKLKTEITGLVTRMRDCANEEKINLCPTKYSTASLIEVLNLSRDKKLLSRSLEILCDRFFSEAYDSFRHRWKSFIGALKTLKLKSPDPEIRKKAKEILEDLIELIKSHRSSGH